MFCKGTHCAGCISPNTRPHRLCWGDQEMRTAISRTECSQIAGFIQKVVGTPMWSKPVDLMDVLRLMNMQLFYSCITTAMCSNVVESRLIAGKEIALCVLHYTQCALYSWVVVACQVHVHKCTTYCISLIRCRSYCFVSLLVFVWLLSEGMQLLFKGSIYFFGKPMDINVD